jgi:hypothetical protein
VCVYGLKYATKFKVQHFALTRTVDDHVHDTYREACAAFGLLAGDREFIDGIRELALLE